MNLFKAKYSFLHYIYIFYYLLIFFTPLVMNSTTSEIFEFNKMIFVYFISLVVTFLYVLHLITNKGKIVVSFFTGVLLLFFATQILSTMYSIDKLTSIFGYYGRWNGGLVSITSYILLFFICIQTFTKKQVITLLRISIISSTVVIVWGLLAAIGFDLSCYIFTGTFTNSCWTAQFNPADRMFSTIGQPNWLGAYLAFHFFVGVYFLLHTWVSEQTVKKHTIFTFLKKMWKTILQESDRKYEKYLYIMYLLLNLTALYMTKSRSTLLAVGFSVLIGILIFIGKQLNLKKRTEEYVLIGVILIASLSFFIGWKTGTIKSFFSLPTEATAITDSFDIRKVVWKGAIDLGLKYPLFGTGVETFAYSYYFTRPAAHNLTSEWDFIYNKAHNEYLNYFATTGFVGVSGYLIMIISVFILYWRLYEQYKEEQSPDNLLLATTLLLGYVTILITNFFGFSVSIIQVLFYLSPAFLIVLNQEEKISQVVHFFKLNLSKKIAVMLTSLVFIYGIYYLANYYIADTEYATAKIKMSNNEYSEALLLLDSARRKKYEHIYEDKMSYTLANLAFLYSFSDEKERTNRYILLADISNLKTLELAPENIQYWRTRGKNYYLFYQINHDEADLQKALVAFQTVTTIAPTDVQSKYTYALFNWIASKEVTDKAKSKLLYNTALSEINKVIQMKPNYIEAQELLKEIIAGK